MVSRKINRVCVIDSAYSLLLYFLISSEDEIDKTFYFWGDGIPEQVRCYFKGKSHYHKEPKRLRNFYHILMYHIIYPIRWPFIMSSRVSFWGHDHLTWSSSVVRNHKMTIIEDGLRNYNPIKLQQVKHQSFRKYLYGPLMYSKEYCYLNDWCSVEVLTGLDNTAPSMKSCKLQKINIIQSWEECSESKKEKIIKIFGLTHEDINKLRSFSNVILTQPYSEDKVLTELEKINLYKKQLRDGNVNGFVIKPHPRESTNYEKYFPNSFVFNKKIPLELLNLCGVTFEHAYTINSTAIYNLPSYTVKHVWGADIIKTYKYSKHSI